MDVNTVTTALGSTTTLPWFSNPADHFAGVFSDQLQVKVLDYSLTNSTPIWKQHMYEDSTEFEQGICTSDGTKLRIMYALSFHSPAACQSLRVSAREFEVLRRVYDIHPEYLASLVAFGSFPDPANGHTTVPTSYRAADIRTFETWYRLEYVERNLRSLATPWSVRHTGLYHQYDNSKNFTLIILIHPCRDSVLETTLFHNLLGSGREVRDSLISNPMAVHRLLCDAYLPNWLLCIRDQTKAQQEINDKVQTMDLRGGTLEDDLRLSQVLRRLRDTVTTNHALCLGNANVLDEVNKLFQDSEENQHWLSTSRAKAQARQDSLLLLQSRAQNDIELLEHTTLHRDSRINQRNQTLAARLNNTLLSLTYNTVDDSATIKIITIFSLIFLPGTFIAAIFGMNFFMFEDERPNSGRDNSALDTSARPWYGLTVGQNFWVFIAIWIPVTAFVLLIYLGVTWRRRKTLHKNESLSVGNGHYEVEV